MSSAEQEKDCCANNFGEGSSFYAALSLIRYPLGISLFLLPWAMKFGGIVAGPIMIAIFVVFNIYRSYVLVRVAEELTDSGVPAPAGFSDWWLLESCLGKIRRTSVNCYLVMFSTLQWLSLLGHACTFLAFAGLSFNLAYPNPDWPGVKGERITIGICVLVVIVVHAITQWIRNSIQNSPCLCVNVCSGFGLVLLPAVVAVFVGIPTIVTFTARLTKEQMPIHPSITVDGANFGLLLAGLVFITGATPDDVTAPFGASRNKRAFPIVLLIVSILVLIILAGFGIAVFFGLDGITCGSVTFNLPADGSNQYQAVRMLSGICALIFVSFRHQIEPKLSVRLSTAEIVCDVIFKMIFLAVAGALAVGVPTFSGLACIFGSLTSFTMTLTYPFFCDLMFHVTGGRTAAGGTEDEGTDLISEGTSRSGEDSQERKISTARVVRDVIFIALGIAGMLYGLYTTIIHLQSYGIHDYTKNCLVTSNFTTTA